MLMELRGPNGHLVGGPGYKLLDQHMRDIPGVKDLSIITRNNQVSAFKNSEKQSFKLKRTDGAFWRILEFNFIEAHSYFLIGEEFVVNCDLVESLAFRISKFSNISSI